MSGGGALGRGYEEVLSGDRRMVGTIGSILQDEAGLQLSVPDGPSPIIFWLRVSWLWEIFPVLPSSSSVLVPGSLRLEPCIPEEYHGGLTSFHPRYFITHRARVRLVTPLSQRQLRPRLV